MVGQGDSSRELCCINDIGYKASERCYVYDVVPLYNPALQGLFLCRDRDLRKSRWGIGEGVACLGEGKEIRVLEVRYSAGRFVYRVCRAPKDGEGWSEGGEGELLLEEEDLVKMAEGKGRGKRKEN